MVFPTTDRIAVERVTPEPVREDGDAGRRRAIVIGIQQTAEHGTKTHDLEERSIDDAGLHDPRLGAETNHGELDGGKVPERADGGDA